MVLAIDIGNTTVAVGCFQGEQVRLLDRMATNRSATALEYLIFLKTIFELHGIAPGDFEGSILSSVVPAVTGVVKDAVERLTKTTPLLVGPGLKTGLKIRLDNAAQLGADRVADAVAAIDRYPAPLIIIDMGTATTVSVVDKERNFIGGVIMPGLRISSEALTNRTSQLPQISLDAPKRAIGRSTAECMRSGLILGCAATIDGIIEKIEEELGYSCTVIGTGGNGKLVMPFCKREILLDEHLLLKGLMILYQKNSK